MVDGVTLRSPAQASRIALRNEGEVDYWTTQLGADEEEVREAVDAVGDNVDAVKAYLNT